ncbi:MAG: hypothetical protein ACKO5I_06855, partial [Ignavibacteria bacterium]
MNTLLLQQYMNTFLRFFLMAMVLFTLVQGELLAQYPKKLSYQGLLLINKDTPYPDSSYDITLTLYDAAQSGNVLWKETQTLTTVNGVFDAILGEITPLSLPFDKQYWLGITINPDPEFSPRVQLVANPYSFSSDTANFAFKSDTSNMSKGLTYNATGAVLSLNGKEGRIFMSGGKGVTITSLGDTLFLDMQASIGPAYSSDLTLDIRRIGDSTDITIANNAIDSKHVKSNAITTSKIADSTITGNKINSMGAIIGQILKWNGTTWAPANDLGNTYTAGKGIDIANNVITNIGDNDSTNDITFGTKAGGDLTGNFPNPIVADGKITNNKIADTAINARTLNRMGANSGQILKWNGTTWIAANDTTGKYFAGAGIKISNDTIINMGDRDSTNDVTITRVSANGEVLGRFDSLYIKDGVVTTIKLANNAVTTAKLADTSVTGAKINRMGATTGQVLKWNGSTWIAANDSSKIYFAGRGIRIANDSIINTGDTDSTDDVSLNLVTTKGDVLGKFDSLYIRNGSVTSNKLNQMGATTGQTLKWNGTTWIPQNDSVKLYFPGQGIAISNDTIINTGDRDSTNDVTITRVSANGEVLGRFDSLYIKDGVVTTIKLANNAVTTAKLADTSVTGAKINRMGATTGQILKWNGTTWAPALDSGKVYKAGLGIAISNDSIINTGDRDSSNDVTITRTSANGEVLGRFDSLYIKDGVVTTIKL